MTARQKGGSPGSNHRQSSSCFGLLQAQLVVVGGHQVGKGSPGQEAPGQGLHLDGCRVAPGVIPCCPCKLAHSSPHLQH